MYACGIRRVAVGDKNNILIRLCSANSFIHGGNSGLNASVIGNVICGNLKAFTADKEKDVMMFAHDLDIGFIAGANRVDGAFMFQIKAMAVEGSGGGVIQDSLIRDLDVKDISEDMSCFSGSDSVRDIEGEDKAENIRGIMDIREIDIRFVGSRVKEVAGFEMILSVLIAELKLRTELFPYKAFSRIKLIEGLNAMRAVIITAFIDSNLFTMFPLKEGAVAIRAEIFGFIVFMESPA